MTAFNVVSYALLQDDPTDATPLILAQISQQLANMTNSGGQIISVAPPYIPSGRFRATTANVVVNILWFASLTFSLISASGAILAKQWFQEYTSLTSSEMTEHVCIRQYRFQALNTWRVSMIMKLLPLFLQVSLFLFFIGLLVLLWTVNMAVAVFITIPVVLWLVFWLTSMVLPSLYGDCPYKSAESIIFFTLVQQLKTSLSPVIRSLWLRVIQIRPLKWLDMPLQTLLRKMRRPYSSWREREKDIVREHMDELTEQTMRCADGILMDERVLAHSIYFYVQSPDPDQVTRRLLGLFQEAADCSEEQLSGWLPDDSR